MKIAINMPSKKKIFKKNFTNVFNLVHMIYYLDFSALMASGFQMVLLRKKPIVSLSAASICSISRRLSSCSHQPTSYTGPFS
jgi:cytochrome b561